MGNNYVFRPFEYFADAIAVAAKWTHECYITLRSFVRHCWSFSILYFLFAFNLPLAIVCLSVFISFVLFQFNYMAWIDNLLSIFYDDDDAYTYAIRPL